MVKRDANAGWIMNPSIIFIDRPVMTTLLMAALVIFGLFGYTQLSVNLPTWTCPPSR